MKSVFIELMSGLDDVESYLAGKTEGFRVHVPEEVNVKEIRNNLHMTQAKFSNTFGFSLDAVKHWEGEDAPLSRLPALI
jgi:putative transcriptional regulator